MPRWTLAVVKSLCETCDTLCPNATLKQQWPPTYCQNSFRALLIVTLERKHLVKIKPCRLNSLVLLQKTFLTCDFLETTGLCNLPGKSWWNYWPWLGAPQVWFTDFRRTSCTPKAASRRYIAPIASLGKKTQLQNLNRRTIITMRLPLNKTHYATVIWRGAFILCFVCVIRTESHTFQACLKLNKFDCSETAVLTATCTNMACSARQKLLPSTSDLCHVVSIWPLRSLGRHTTQLFYTMYCIFRDIFSPVRVANRGLCAVGHSQATRIVDLFGSFFGRKYFENLWQVTTWVCMEAFSDNIG